MTLKRTNLNPSRRQFIAGGVGAGLAVPLVRGLAPRGLAPRWMQAASGASQKVVYIILAGGNDAINNMVNPDEPKYAAARPNIKLPKSKMVRLDNSLPYYLHPALQPFKALYDLGELVVLPGIGYPKPNFSHFRAMDIWAAADPATSALRSGWLANFLNKVYAGADPVKAIDIEGRLNRVLVGFPAPVFRNPAQFSLRTDPPRFINDDALELSTIDANAKVLRPTAHPNLAFLASSLGRIRADSALLTSTGSNYTPKATYSTTTARARLVASQLQLAARYIVGGLTTPLYVASVGGWDLHANGVLASDSTLGTHHDQLAAVADNVKAFLDDLKAWGKANDVTVVVTSEFGRRVGENGNLGTDHGHAGIAYVAGKTIKSGGVKSPYMDWSKAKAPYNRSNFLHTVDFRRLYATLLDDLWKVDSTKVLGKKFASLGIF